MTVEVVSEEPNLSLAEAARRLGVSRHTLRNWAKYQRRISYLRLGRRLVFTVRDLQAFEQRCRVEANKA
jgi:excisionase family DNA binding protein